MDVSIGKTSLAVGRLELDLGMQILHDANPPYNPNTCHREERSDVAISDTGR